jgi:probable HAF family extracellular repeat protein
MDAFLWEDGVMSDLGALGNDGSAAFGINEQSQVAGYSNTTIEQVLAFLWEDGTMTDLGTLGGSYSLAFGINDLGQVVGYIQTASGEEHASLWTVSSPPASPKEQIDAIIEHIARLVETGVLNKGQGNALQIKLENTLRQLDKVNPEAACNLLQAFTNQVQSLVDGEILPFDEGQLLIDEASAVKIQICP